jgi:hypothetical protein
MGNPHRNCISNNKPCSWTRRFPLEHCSFVLNLSRRPTYRTNIQPSCNPINASWYLRRRGDWKKTNILTKAKWAAVATTTGILTRVLFMSVVLYYALPQPSPIGFSFPLDLTIGYLPFAALFNATLALYTIPIGWLIAHRVQKVLHLTMPQAEKCPVPNNK